MNILAIETSCDETGIALLTAQGGLRAPKFSVPINLVSSQIKIHRPFGGVVPNLAKREHLKNLPILYRKIFGDGAAAARLWKKIGFVTVTVGPGLEPALWTGIEFAKKLSKEHGKPLVGANHLEGHLYSFLLPTPKKKSTGPHLREGDHTVVFPAVALIVSGGHTVLLRMESFSKWRRLGETRDDAAGEAFDKVARLLDLPYPGGPEIERLAKTGDPNSIAFPRPMLHEKNYDFSFSGLKTAVLYFSKENTQAKKKDIAASFQEAAVDVLVKKTMRAAEEYDARSVILCGGVAANKKLRTDMRTAAKKIGVSFFAPETVYNFDNAAMIGAAGYMVRCRGKKYRISAQGTLDV
jgi:N6-L-threonylcarbamoyladenine synthase